jgi:hypothetical protein
MSKKEKPLKWPDKIRAPVPITLEQMGEKMKLPPLTPTEDNTIHKDLELLLKEVIVLNQTMRTLRFQLSPVLAAPSLKAPVTGSRIHVADRSPVSHRIRDIRVAVSITQGLIEDIQGTLELGSAPSFNL